MKSKILSQSPQFLTYKLLISLFFSSLLILVSCNNESIDGNEYEASKGNIVAVLKSFDTNSEVASKTINGKRGNEKPTFKALTVALAKTGLSGIYSSNQLTAFAPTDAAFEKLGLNHQNIASVPNLASILLYHVVVGKVYSTDLQNGFVETLNGASVEINLGDGVMVNMANVDLAYVDIEARNGVIHAIDSVLFPPAGNIVEVASSFDPEFTSLLKAATIAGLADVLMMEDMYTVFAPTNEAFENLISGLDGFNSLDDFDSEDEIELLRKIVLYHVVPGKVFSTDLSDGYTPTANGAAVMVKIDGNVYINDAMVTAANVQATNGIIHVIDKVLLPPMQNLKDLAISAFGIDSSLVQAVIKAGLVDALESGGPYTVFIPTEEAFVNLIGELDGVESLDDLDAATLEAVLKYHIVEGRVYSSDLMSGWVETLNGTFNIDVNTLEITDNNNRVAMLDAASLNIQATNGVVHIINKVLLP
ncbi:fasciclin domain-containing protein [Gaetbulibacter saemankumensis]|uniref:fasciclin domain-containing protein n=1 Tax=Gaetbulibacter saemankumensis TaxID=311208 RepID=UPI000488005B|nr:fasciclin domain-containing protein [Gaetbulibacter saemankumensis]